MPLNMRLPKKGFTNHFRKDVEIVNLGALAAFGDGATVDAGALAERGLIRGTGGPVKLLGERGRPEEPQCEGAPGQRRRAPEDRSRGRKRGARLG